MKKKLIIICIAVGISLTLAATSFAAPTLFLNADSLTVGTYTAGSPLVFSTTYGDITFVGEIYGDGGDPEFIAAGASGNTFDVANDTHWAELSFDFDVDSAEFIYGGNKEVITVEARDAGNAVLDSLIEAPTADSQPAGPVTLSGPGIRSLYWVDVDKGEAGIRYMFAALDNITLTLPEEEEPEHPPGWIPAPGAILLGSIGVGLVGWLRRRKSL